MNGPLIGRLGCFISRVITDLTLEPIDSQESVDSDANDEYILREDNDSILYKNLDSTRRCHVNKRTAPFTITCYEPKNPFGFSVSDSINTTDEGRAHEVAYDFVMGKFLGYLGDDSYIPSKAYRSTTDSKGPQYQSPSVESEEGNKKWKDVKKWYDQEDPKKSERQSKQVDKERQRLRSSFLQTPPGNLSSLQIKELEKEKLRMSREPLPESEQARKLTLTDKIYIYGFVLFVLLAVWTAISAAVNINRY